MVLLAEAVALAGCQGVFADPGSSAPGDAESDALVRRVVFGDTGAWSELFTAEETYFDAAVAETYGLDAPSEGSAWVE